MKHYRRYLENISLPVLTHQARQELEAASFPTCKAPGDDGIPMEVYTQYGEITLPKILTAFNLKTGQLPITRANILLLKPGKKKMAAPSSYRPISLLQRDVKILAKVLAIRLNRDVLTIVHSDQAGFMPRKYTATTSEDTL